MKLTINNRNNMDYKKYITEIPNFPQHGVSFKDISPLLSNRGVWNDAMNKLYYKLNGNLPDYWVGVDSRGFLIASAFNSMFNNSNVKGMKLLRKKGKLPPPTIAEIYDLEYGTSTLEIQPGVGSVVILDDVYATGGTMKAAEKLCTRAGYNVVDKLVLIDLTYLHNDLSIKSLIQYK